MKTKTWKIGEYAQGGVITVEIKGKVVSIIGKEWDFSKGTKKSSDQSGAKEFTRETALTTDDNFRYKCLEYLNELTSSYYADEIMKWIDMAIKSKFESKITKKEYTKMVINSLRKKKLINEVALKKYIKETKSGELVIRTFKDYKYSDIEKFAGEDYTLEELGYFRVGCNFIVLNHNQKNIIISFVLSDSTQGIYTCIYSDI